MGDLTKNFDSTEMRCRCGCGICIVDPGFMLKLQTARNLACISFIIRSGCRCPEHNAVEGGTENSDHLTTSSIACEGVDIHCDNSTDRYTIISAAILAGFRRIGVESKNKFIHLGTAKRNPENVLWIY